MSSLGPQRSAHSKQKLIEGEDASDMTTTNEGGWKWQCSWSKSKIQSTTPTPESSTSTREQATSRFKSQSCAYLYWSFVCTVQAILWVHTILLSMAWPWMRELCKWTKNAKKVWVLNGILLFLIVASVSKLFCPFSAVVVIKPHYLGCRAQLLWTQPSTPLSSSNMLSPSKQNPGMAPWSRMKNEHPLALWSCWHREICYHPDPHWIGEVFENIRCSSLLLTTQPSWQPEEIATDSSLPAHC